MKTRNFKEYLGITLRGVLMGGADVVPGVSGGTIAFITGIYQELLDSVSAINLNAFRLLLKGQFSDFWKTINGNFFIFLLIGIAASIISLAQILNEIVSNPEETKEKILLWSFFFGLITASSVYIGKQINKWNIKNILGLLIGTIIAFGITIMAPASGTDASWYLFFAGFIAICAMILPGISGSFILLLMGVYPIVLGSISNMVEGLKTGDTEILMDNGFIICVFASGCIVGLLSFARLVSFLFKKSPETTMAVLTGFLIGSLNKVWPWKETIESRLNSHGISVPYIQENQLPDETGYVAMSILIAILGFILVFGIDWLGEKMKKEA